jgi:hypothetical protein
MIFEFRIPEGILLHAKKPYDVSHHEALVFSAKTLAEAINKVARVHVPILVTDKSVFVQAYEVRPVTQMICASLLTAALNKVATSKGLVTFNIFESKSTFEEIQSGVRKYSKATYELFLENPEMNKEPSLFGPSFYLPYEQTPTYFREGIFI